MILRAVLAGTSVVVAAVAGVVTNVYTTGWGWPWAVALATLVVLGAGLQVAASLLPGGRVVRATGAGAVAVGGTVRGPVRTRVSGPTLTPVPDATPTPGSGAAPARGSGITPPGIAGAAADPGRTGDGTGDAVAATGAGAVAVGGDVTGAVETSVDGDHQGPAG